MVKTRRPPSSSKPANPHPEQRSEAKEDSNEAAAENQVAVEKSERKETSAFENVAGMVPLFEDKQRIEIGKF